MNREQLHTQVVSRFGPRLQRGSFDELEAFLADLEMELPGPGPGDSLSVDDAANSYETAMREFFGRSLELGDEEAFCRLWITAMRMWVATMQEHTR